MCLILFSYNNHPKYKMILAANRDEFYARPTVPAHFWEDDEHILAGKDLEAGGTWLGVTKEKRLCVITNYRDLNNIKPNAPSRGQLVSDFLKQSAPAKDYLNEVAQNGHGYNGFNLICDDGIDMYYYGNYQKGVHKITPGLHGLSNALLNTPWPKVQRGISKLEEVIKSNQIEEAALFDILYDDIKAPDNQLPDTGVGYEKEKMLSPMFIKSNNYGSRCSTIVLIAHDGTVSFAERTYNTTNFDYTTKSFRF